MVLKIKFKGNKYAIITYAILLLKRLLFVSMTAISIKSATSKHHKLNFFLNNAMDDYEVHMELLNLYAYFPFNRDTLKEKHSIS